MQANIAYAEDGEGVRLYIHNKEIAQYTSVTALVETHLKAKLATTSREEATYARLKRLYHQP
ncbi:MAG: hypothetical protein ACO3JV_05015 [Pseudomonadales bacterium]